MTTLTNTVLQPLFPRETLQPYRVKWQHTTSYVKVVVSGHLTPSDLIGLMQQIGDDATTWVARSALIDLRPVSARLGCMQHLLIGQEMAHCLDHRLDMVAVLTQQDLPAMERAACTNAEQAEMRFFRGEDAALDWLLSVEFVG